jgi:small-conductance mechanosensitive channel
VISPSSVSRSFRASSVLVLSILSPLPVWAADPAEPTSRGAVLSGVIATLAVVAWVAAVLWLHALVRDRLKALAVEKTRQITSARLRHFSLRRLGQLVVVGIKLVAIALVVLGVLAWVIALLDLLPATHATARAIENQIFAEAERLLLGAATALPGLFVVVLIYFATRIVQELLNHYFRSIAEGEIESNLFDPVTAETSRRLADVGLWIAALIIAFPYIPGSESPAFRGVTVLAGLMLSLGSSNLVAQFASGLALIYGRAIRPGEYVAIGEHEGTVERIGLFACSLRTAKSELLVLPHSAVSAGLKNLSRLAAEVRYSTTVTIGYDTPWRQVRDLLLAAAAATPGIRAEPAPEVRQPALQDFYVAHELRFTPENPADRLELLSRLHAAIQDEFHRAGVQIMSPHYLGDPAASKVPPGRPPN